MSKRAEEAALKAYPKEEGKVWSSAFGIFEFDKTAPERTAYQKGYEQAEKDLALTLEDIQLIIRLNEEVMAEAGGKPKDYYKEVLRRFNAKRNEKEI